VARLVPDPRWSYNYALAYRSSIAFIWLYLPFAGEAIASPIVRPFRSRPLLVLLGIASVVWALQPWIFPLAFVGPGRPGPLGGWDWGPGTLSPLVQETISLLLAALFAVTTIAAFDAWKRAPEGTPSRERAKAYLIAFMVNDVTVVFALTIGVFGPPDWGTGLDTVENLCIAVFLVLLVRAMLRYQLFDFDLKVKWTLKRGTLVAIVLAVFFVATAVAEQYLQGYGFVVGGIAIGLLLFAIRPVERAIDRMADRAMPKTTGSPDYIAYRKLEVYRAAVESEIETHGHDHEEHAVLERLRVKLGISREDADALQREARERVAEASA
jgi:hypothetical protein